MPVAWKSSTVEAHESLPKKTTGVRDPEWEVLLDELERGNAVMIECHDTKQCTTLARSVGRRASHRGFKADIRRGDGYLSVRQADAAASKSRKRA